MFPVVGIVVLILLVFGGFALTGGNLGPVMHALPHEMLIIGGAAVGSLIIGNSGADLKALGGGLMKVFKGPAYKKQDYLDCILLVSTLMKMMRTEGPVAVEPHIEDPNSSTIFQQYPKLLKDGTLIHLICDTLRLVVVSSGTLDPHAVEEVMDNALKSHHHHSMKPAEGLQSLADALPALGIVAAVLGVVKTMGSIDQPPAILWIASRNPSRPFADCGAAYPCGWLLHARFLAKGVPVFRRPRVARHCGKRAVPLRRAASQRGTPLVRRCPRLNSYATCAPPSAMARLARGWAKCAGASASGRAMAGSGATTSIAVGAGWTGAGAGLGFESTAPGAGARAAALGPVNRSSSSCSMPRACASSRRRA